MLEDHKITLDVTASALEWLSEAGYDPIYGARPLKRVIQRMLQNPLAQDLLAGKVVDGEKVKVDAGHDGLVLKAMKVKKA